MLRVVAPVLQVLPVGILDVNTTLSPGHNAVGPLAVITGGVVIAFTTVTEADDEQPLPLVTVTV